MDAQHHEGPDPDAWRLVDEGWGRRAPEFATLSEPANAREYVALHHRLGIEDGDRVLDLACGSGLALELASLRGASVAGIDASRRLVAVARDRVPGADVRVGDMHALPWEDDSFDVVTSFRGIWGTTPEALAEARRVLVPGGRLGFTVWGHIKKSPGAWALAPFAWRASRRWRTRQRWWRSGAPAPARSCWRATASWTSSGWWCRSPGSSPTRSRTRGPWPPPARRTRRSRPSASRSSCVAPRSSPQEHVREGLPLRAEIDVVGYMARAPQEDADAWPHDSRAGGFLAAPGHRRRRCAGCTTRTRRTSAT